MPNALGVPMKMRRLASLIVLSVVTLSIFSPSARSKE